MEDLLESTMKTKKVSLKEANAFPSMFLDYIRKDPSLASFYRSAPTVDNFREVLENRNFSNEKRIILHEVLNEQYAVRSSGGEFDFGPSVVTRIQGGTLFLPIVLK